MRRISRHHSRTLRLAGGPALLALLVLPAACTMVQTSGDEFGGETAEPRIVTPEQVARRAIDAGDARDHVRFLASDEMRGRNTPSPELEHAAAWIAERFRQAGLRPAGDDGGFLQFWPFERNLLDTDAVRLGWRDGDRGLEMLDYGQDFAALAGGRAGAGVAEGELVWLGMAQDAPDSMHLAQGRVAMVLLPGDSPQAWRYPVTVRRSMITAGRAGALGVIFVLDPAFGAADIATLAQQFAGPVAEPQALPLFFLRRDAAATLATAVGGNLSRLVAMAEGGSRETVVMNGDPTLAAAPPRRVDVSVPNVVATLPGSDSARAEEYIILTAHFDHEGIGPADETGDSIYNGADDNASGTAALIEIAQAFGELTRAPARPILFLATSGEEKGLLGAQWFARNPSVFLSSAVANLNMDMVGRNHPDSVVAVGYDYSDLGPLLANIARTTPSLGLTVAPDPAPEQNLFQRSDHWPFAQANIPAIAISSFLHEDYHRPSDEADRIDADKIARIARLLFLAAYDLASSETEPAWTEAGRAAIRR